jgi:protocatechuate 4,5-dioxygenase alpha chain
MGSVDRCVKTLRLNEVMYEVRRDPVLRERFRTDLEAVCRELGLSSAEYEALRDRDVRRLHEIGVHQYYVPQLLRLFYGASLNTNTHPALEAYRKAYPEESARAFALAAEIERRTRS